MEKVIRQKKGVTLHLSEVAAVRSDTKRMPGLIHFVGHGAYWEPKVVGNLIVSDRNAYIY